MLWRLGKGGRSKMSKYRSQPGCSRMKPLKRCKTKEYPNVVLIDVDDDDVIVVDSPESSHPKPGGSSEVRENRRVSPQSVISIEDDDESYTNHFSAHEEGGFAEFESDATSSQRSVQASGIPRHAGPHGNGGSACPRNSASRNCYRFGDDEYECEPLEVDSDCEVMEDSSGKLREEWEKAALQKKVNGNKVHFGPEGSRGASIRQDTTYPFSEVPSCSRADVPFTHLKTPSTYNVVNEENPMHDVQDNLFPEFEWWNLGGRSSTKKPVSSDKRDFFKEKTDKSFEGISSQNQPCQNNVGGPSLSSNRAGVNGQCNGNSLETEGTRWGFSSNIQPGYKMSINQIDSSIGHEMNASSSYGDTYFGNRNHGEQVHTTYVECDCIFPSFCACRRSRYLNVEEQVPNPIPCKEKSNNSKAALDNNILNASSSFPIGADCEANCSKDGSQEKDGEFEKLSRSDTLIRQGSHPASEKPAVETDANCVQVDGKSDAPAVEGELQSLQSDIINDKEKLKETEEYKRAMEQELALRQQQIKLQAEEAQKLRKKKKAEIMRLSNMEKRQKQRLEEVRASQKQDEANLNLKEQLRSEIIKELKVLEMRCFDMASLLRSLGVPVEGGVHPSPQQVHAAYKRAVLKFHPDRTSGSNLKQQVEAEEKFKLISRMKEKYKFQ